MGSVIGIIIFFWILSAILKKSGARERISRKDSVNIGKIIGLIALSACGLLPIFLVIWAFSAASKDAKNNKNGQVNRNMYSNRPTEGFRSADTIGGSSGTSPYGSTVNNYRTGMNPNAATNYSRPGGMNPAQAGGAYYTGYTTRPVAGTNAASYQDQARNMTNAYNNAINYSGIYNNQKPNSYGLPSAEKKRTKIVKKFSDKYNLYLTDREIKRIVDASYLSSGWAREICYMNQKYDTVYAWYASMNPWLKVYLYAFQQQNISSDFAMQERIVYDAFNTVFSDVCSDGDLTIDQAIRRINEKYLTNFDETTFMIAYRYMESKGKKYSFAFGQVLNTQEDIDELLSKYEGVAEGTPTPMQ
ncbi:MAG: hypothetical protein J6Y20_11090 [Lachnospiraceae bacterium]|nr:hypothetical protein [Lachnospiraceae bacterium]